MAGGIFEDNLMNHPKITDRSSIQTEFSPMQNRNSRCHPDASIVSSSLKRACMDSSTPYNKFVQSTRIIQDAKSKAGLARDRVTVSSESSAAP